MTVWPQVTLSILMLINAGMVLDRMGKPKTGTYGFIELLIAPALSVTLLYFGGFYTSIGWHP